MHNFAVSVRVVANKKETTTMNNAPDQIDLSNVTRVYDAIDIEAEREGNSIRLAQAFRPANTRRSGGGVSRWVQDGEFTKQCRAHDRMSRRQARMASRSIRNVIIHGDEMKP